MARGRGGKAKRGGGHSFSRDLVLNEDGVAVSSGGGRSSRRARAADDERVFNGSDPEEGQSGEESEEEEEEEVEEEEEETPAAPSSDGPVDTAAARAAKKAQKAQAKAKATKAAEDEEGDNDEDLVNPNHATPKNFKAADLAASAAPSRREREAIEKKEAQLRYQKLHAAGKTDQAKSDLARLAEIRKQREAAAAQRKAEQQEKIKEAEAKAAASNQKRL